MTSASKRRMPRSARDLGELLEHAGREAAALHVVGHGERDLGDARLVQSVVARDRDDPLAEPREERHPQVAVGVGVVARDDVGPARAVEAHVAALGPQAVEERLDRRLVRRRGRAQPQRAAVAQDDVADEEVVMAADHRATATRTASRRRPIRSLVGSYV